MSSTVNQIQVSVDADGKVHCTPDPVVVKGANALLVFQLVTPDWAFDANQAIVVESGGSSFPCPSWTVSPQTAALLDVDNQKGDFAYTVTIVHEKTGQKVLVDPTIRNEG